MRQVICDRCGEVIVGKVNQIALKIVEGQFFLNKIPLADQVKDLCQDCFLSVGKFVKEKPKPNCGVATANQRVKEYKQDRVGIIAQLERCNYETEGGFLVNNVAWVALKELINEGKI